MKDKKNLRIGFDFDKVFVNYPPLIPDFLIDWIYKSKKKKLEYRFPGELEQKIRITSHHPFLRPPIKNNIKSLENLAKEKKHNLFLISSRFGFLEKRTNEWFKRNKFNNFFNAIHFNFSDKQPHKFKDEMIKKLNIDLYIDDDLDTISYLAQSNNNKKFYWIIKNSFFLPHELPKNVIPVKNIEEFIKKHLK